MKDEMVEVMIEDRIVSMTESAARMAEVYFDGVILREKALRPKEIRPPEIIEAEVKVKPKAKRNVAAKKQGKPAGAAGD